MTVTGPSAASSFLIYSIQVVIIYFLTLGIGTAHVSSMVVAALLRLVTRHAFFATNHGCAFNRLQVSAAFSATKTFYYELGGISLFLNTFGWEI
eukprot:CAMPEP_0198142846 /NCGR_PEP_ID=MMETSP1443-20131203/5531_1 /TAXON_ID=186043 /ORGANISM="Entomoneis sp., Strain CCMP2396" /LENGTH=93 /DNA_ID=CAMNT_0043805949 /DNA_START=16 /DNA_END=294 /DNA_ORIENTATION=+